MRKLKAAIRELDDLTGSEDYLLASDDTATVADQCRRALIEAGHADHAESLSDLGGRADPQVAGDRLRAILSSPTHKPRPRSRPAKRFHRRPSVAGFSPAS